MRSLVIGAVLGGLVAQRKQANNYQNALLAQQALEEQVASAQIAYMNDVEANRQQEKTHEIWREEFKHQGMSPMEAQLQIQSEIELSELMKQGLPKRPDLVIEIAKIKDSYLRPFETAILDIFFSMKRTVIGFFVTLIPAIFTLPHLLNSKNKLFDLINLTFIICLTLMPILFIKFYKAHKVLEEKEKEENLESMLAEASLRIYEKFLGTVERFQTKVASLPKSRLIDDSEFRQKIEKEVGALKKEIEAMGGNI